MEKAPRQKVAAQKKAPAIASDMTLLFKDTLPSQHQRQARLNIPS
jgi:hypothetical protein